MTHHYPAVASAAFCAASASVRFATRFVALLVGLFMTTLGYGQTPTVSLTVSNGLSCSALSATLTAASSCTGTIIYRFSGPNDFTLVNTTGTASVTVDGAYSVTATNAGNLCTATNSLTISSSLHPDYLPLVDLYNSTNGPGWTNRTGWLTNCDPCSGWFGVGCAGGRVTGLILYKNNLRGAINNSLSKVLTIRDILFFDNQLTGNIPETFSDLINLNNLLLMDNQLTGKIPSRIGSLRNLKAIWIKNNRLEGRIPDNIADISGLQSLLLGNNELTGSIPAGLGTLKDLGALQLMNNNLSGCIPFSLTTLCGQQIDISNNSGLPNGGDWAAFCNSRAGTCPPCSETVDIEITTQPPSSSFICTRGIVTLTLSATSNQSLSYQWYRNGFALTNGANTNGVTSSTLAMVNVQTASAGTYYAVATSSCGSLTSSTFSLTVNPPTHPDYTALADLFYSTNGMGWTNRTKWLTSCDPCSGWFGVTCAGGRVTRLVMLSNNMSGSIPESINQISSLTALAIPYNPITGTLPASLSSLSNFESLWIQNAQLSGSIPGRYDQLKKLTVLNLSGNQLTGAIPAGLTSLTNITQFWLSYNQLTGTLPRSWSSLANVSSINLAGNPFESGPIPIELSKLPNLANLFLEGTNLTGQIPADFGNLPKLNYLSLSQNQLSGCIPLSLTTLCGQNVQISNNPGLPNGGNWAAFCATGAGACPPCDFAITTQPPTSSAICTRGIVTLTVSATASQAVTYQWFKSGVALSNVTNLSGVTSATLTMVDVQTLNAGTYYVVATSSCGSLTSNTFSLTVNPPTHPDYAALADLFYSTNGMGWTNRTGWLTNCDPCNGWFGVTCGGGRVAGLDMANNKLSGALPVSLNSLTSLIDFRLSTNRLVGTIPQSMSVLTNLRSLEVSRNQLSGNIPLWIGNLTNLRFLYLADNQFSGTIPNSFSALVNVRDLMLYSNQLTGSIPASLGNLRNVEILWLDRNQLYGSIPLSFTALTSLAWLTLSINHLSGCIPSSLTALCGKSVNISNNPSLPNGGDWAAFCATGAGGYNGTLTTTQTGYWHNKMIWSCGAVPQAGDRAVVQHPVTVAPVQLNQAGILRYEGAGKLIYEAGGMLRLGQ